MSRTRSCVGAVGLGALLVLFAGCGSDDSLARSPGSGAGGTTPPPDVPTPPPDDPLQPPSGSGGVVPDPTTCAEAASSRTYVGCDFWPTVLDNTVRPIFDFAVVVANTNASEATVEVTRGTAKVATATVPGNGLSTIYLPWVPELKAMAVNPVCETMAMTQTVKVKTGAYHLTSTVPVAVYQFNAIEYTNKGGPPGKDWSACWAGCLPLGPCASQSNDASLLLPTTALTGNYRIAGLTSQDSFPAYFGVTGTKDGTTVTVKLGPDAAISPGGGISGSGTVTFTIDEGEVAEIIGTAKSDFSGTLVNATAPVQVITGMACAQNPVGKQACDHLEESVFPVETLGKRYFVTAPTSPTGTPSSYTARLYGNVDGTKLTFLGAKPARAPSTIDAAKTVDLGLIEGDFEVIADHELTIATTQIGAGAPVNNVQGDPSYSFMSSVEQYRVKYVFLGPSDYDTNWADIVQPMNATLELDGAPVTAKPRAISSGYGVTRIKLGPGKDGAHVLTSSAPVGLQVLGYGAYTSYQYPGGLNLGRIAPPPIK